MGVTLPTDERGGVGRGRVGGVRRRGKPDRGGLLIFWGEKVILIDINLLFIGRVNAYAQQKEGESCD